MKTDRRLQKQRTWSRWNRTCRAARTRVLPGKSETNGKDSELCENIMFSDTEEGYPGSQEEELPLLDSAEKAAVSARVIAAFLVSALKARNWTITAVESCTGGMIAETITSVAGSSAVLKQSYVTYCDEAKHYLVGVRRRTLQEHTAVSWETAQEMAEGGLRDAGADLAVSVTGYAGPPSGSPGETIGLVYIGCSFHKSTIVRKYQFSGDRESVRRQACARALAVAAKMIKAHSEASGV